MEIILLIYFCFRIVIKAKMKSLNPIVWSIYTIIAFLSAEFIGIIVVLVYFLKNKINISEYMPADDAGSEEVRELSIELADKLKHEFTQNPLLIVTIYFFGVGGYLLIRYLIDRKPIKDANKLS